MKSSQSDPFDEGIKQLAELLSSNEDFKVLVKLTEQSPSSLVAAEKLWGGVSEEELRERIESGRELTLQQSWKIVRSMGVRSHTRGDNRGTGWDPKGLNQSGWTEGKDLSSDPKFVLCWRMDNSNNTVYQYAAKENPYAAEIGRIREGMGCTALPLWEALERAAWNATPDGIAFWAQHP